jgi:hypothetical protein
VSRLLASPRRRRRLAWLGGALVVVVVAGAVIASSDKKRLPADNLREGAAAPRQEREVPLTAATRRAIDDVLDEFIPAAVGRHDRARAWELAGPGLRAGSTRQNWVTGDFPVHPYPYAEQSFRSWRKSYAHRDRVAIDLLLLPRAGADIGPVIFAVDFVRLDGQWLVDSIYPASILPRPAGSRQSEPREAGPAAEPHDEARLGPVWLLVPGIIFGAALLFPLALGVRGLLARRRRVRHTALPPLPRAAADPLPAPPDRGVDRTSNV